MMTGPEHYRNAERLLAMALEADANDAESAFATAQAQVHATLALAAATVDARRGGSNIWASWPEPAMAHEHSAWCIEGCAL